MLSLWQWNSRRAEHLRENGRPRGGCIQIYNNILMQREKLLAMRSMYFEIDIHYDNEYDGVKKSSIVGLPWSFHSTMGETTTPQFGAASLVCFAKAAKAMEPWKPQPRTPTFDGSTYGRERTYLRWEKMALKALKFPFLEMVPSYPNCSVKKQARTGNDASGLSLRVLIMWHIWIDRWTNRQMKRLVVMEALKSCFSLSRFSVGSHRGRKQPKNAVFAQA